MPAPPLPLRLLSLPALLLPLLAAAEPAVRAYRCALDNRVGMLVLDFGDGIHAAWDTRGGFLYRVWKGDVELTGTVYDTRHGPRPKVRGEVLFTGGEGAATRPATPDGPESTQPAVPPEIVALGEPDPDRRWIGHSLAPDHVTLLVGTDPDKPLRLIFRRSDAGFPVRVESAPTP